MENIFKNAYFGKAYKTRDGRKAILISYNQRKPSTPYVCAVACYLDNSIKSNCYNFNEFGKRRIDILSTYDIVSEWEEEIDDEELDKLAEQNNPYPSYDKSDMCVAHSHDGFNEGFITCYRKALEQL